MKAITFIKLETYQKNNGKAFVLDATVIRSAKI